MCGPAVPAAAPCTRCASITAASLTAAPITFGWLQLNRIAAASSASAARTATATGWPELLALGLREKDGQFGRTSILLQSLNGSTWNGALTIRAAAALREVAGSVQPPAEIAGGFFVSAQILEALNREALPTTLASFAGVVLVVAVLFRAHRQSLAVLAALRAGVTLLAGAVVVFDIRINFLNFMAFPITFGIGVEYAINVLQRYRENPADMAAIVSKTGGDVAPEQGARNRGSTRAEPRPLPAGRALACGEVHDPAERDIIYKYKPYPIVTI